MMLEMFGGSLHGVNHVGLGKGCAVMAGNADEQTAHERELGREQGEFMPHGRLNAGLHSFAAEGELAAQKGIGEEVFHDVRMALEEGSVAAVMG
jgi:hypothetical protein